VIDLAARCLVIGICCVVTTPAAAQVRSSAEEVPSVGSLFSGLPGDFVQLASLRTVVLLGSGGALAVAVSPRDAELTRRAAASGMLEEVLDGGEVLGNGALHAGGAFATYALGRLAHSPRFASAAARLVRAQLLNAGLTHALKFAVNRERPDSGRCSFPSGHSSASFATATILQREFGWKAGLVAYAAATYVATSRMSENSHYASDVIFGAAVGIASAYAVHFESGSGRVTVSPFASPGRRGIAITIVSRR
jgi:membrane-associated phospholipid phosphatase